MAKISFVHARDHADVLLRRHARLGGGSRACDHPRNRLRRVLLYGSRAPGRLPWRRYQGIGLLPRCRPDLEQERGPAPHPRHLDCSELETTFMVSLGDDRVAAPGAKLIYHHARASNTSDLTASTITDLHGRILMQAQ